MDANLIVGIDIGGTFTDLTVYDPSSGEVVAVKAPSDRAAPDNGVMAALEKAGIDLARCRMVVHGTTVATNSLLERSGPPVALITTEGFRDVVELGRTTRLVPGTLYNPYFVRTAPFVRRRERFEIEERTTADGASVTPPDPARIADIADAIQAAGIEAVAICFVNSYANATHEAQAAQLLRQRLPFVTTSAAVLNEVREFERFSTCVVNAYLMPMMSRYASRLRERLSAGGLRGPFYTIASNGGLLSEALVHDFPVRTILSGPAAGISAATYLMQACGEENFITYDMGGTSSDVALVSAGDSPVKRETILDGILLRVPQLDIHTIGAGGGSIAERDAGGSLLVGPASAGADPGPACYGRGGKEPTVTDANVVLGRLGGKQRLGDSLALDHAAAVRVVSELGDPIGLSAPEMATGILRVAVAKMAQALYEVSVAKGHDPREFVLLPYGGAGPLHACEVADEIGIETVVVPPSPGAFSAYGGLCSSRFRDGVATILRLLDPPTLVELWATAEELARSLTTDFGREGVDKNELRYSYEIDLRYHGQAHELTIVVPEGASLAAIQKRFEATFRRQYGRLDEDKAVEVVNLRVIAEVPPHPPALVESPRPPAGSPVDRSVGDASTAALGTRPIFGAEGSVSTPVFAREALPVGCHLPGPLVVEEMSATTYVPAHWALSVGTHRELRIIRLGG